MSYARFSNADVYVYLDVGGYFNCCACWLASRGEGKPFHDNSYFRSTDDLLVHLAVHKAAGHDVPDYCIERLESEKDENDAWIAKRHRKR